MKQAWESQVLLLLVLALFESCVEADNANMENARRHIKPRNCRGHGDGKRCEIDLSALGVIDPASPPDEIQVQLSLNGPPRNFKRQNSGLKSKGLDDVWVGMDGDSTINLIKTKQNHVVGSLVDVENHQVCSLNTDDRGLPVSHCKDSSEYPPELHPQSTPPGVRADEPDTDGTSDSRRQANVIHTMDVMVVWTKNAECSLATGTQICTLSSETTTAMMNLINLAVSETNVAYAQSGVKAQLRLVHAYRDPNYVETSNAFNDALTHITAKNDGFMDDVHTTRSSVGADLVAMIIDDRAYCGLAWMGPATKEYMFSVCSHTCATGYFSFGHEIGHNLGCDHDRGTAGTCSSADSNFGYRDPEASFRTILAYACVTGQCDNNVGGACTRIQRFSTPDVLYNTKMIGNSMNNNVLRMNQYVATVAAYYTSMPVAPTPTPTPAPTPVATLSPCTGCYGCTTFTESSGTFSDGSGNFMNYPNDADCRWIIAPASASSVSLTFSLFATESEYDFVEIYSCPDVSCSTGTTSKIVGLSGGPFQGPYTSRTGIMLVKFTSDKDIQKAGFVASYYVPPTPAPSPAPTCTDDPSFNAGLGTCNTYAVGGANYGWCFFDDACIPCSYSCSAECGNGCPTPTTRAPTPAPTGAATPAPTPATTRAPTPAPTRAATPAPTPATTRAPTPAPTRAATPAPTRAATPAPTPATTRAPTPAPTRATTPAPTPATTRAPTPAPTRAATPAPTRAATPAPTPATSRAPTPAPTRAATPAPTPAPTRAPTPAPTTRAPTPAPTTRVPTRAPTPAPTTRVPTRAPTPAPTRASPTRAPTSPAPTRALTSAPTPAVLALDANPQRVLEQSAPTPASASAPTAQNATGAPIGIITGGVLGGLAFLAASLFVWRYVHKRRSGASIIKSKSEQIFWTADSELHTQTGVLVLPPTHHLFGVQTQDVKTQDVRISSALGFTTHGKAPRVDEEKSGRSQSGILPGVMRFSTPLSCSASSNEPRVQVESRSRSMESMETSSTGNIDMEMALPCNVVIKDSRFAFDRALGNRRSTIH